jgi:hypothetical protein
MGWRGGTGFRIKLGLAGILVVLADQLFYGYAVGSTLGFFALTLLIAVLAVHPATRQDARARWSLLVAAGFVVVQIEAPTALGGGLFCTALAVGVLSPRVGAGGDILRWCRRLLFLVVAGLPAPARDLWRVERTIAKRRGGSGMRLSMLIPPLLGGAIFVALFASANPVVDWAVRAVWRTPLDVSRLLFWFAVLIGVWMFLRPRVAKVHRRAASVSLAPRSRVSAASVCLCLIVFNAIFAVENGLDIAFLWSGARLPAGVSFANYAHRGAYTLMATAVLAALFVLIALRPGSATAKAPWPRRLVTLWVGQNLMLVASSMLRTFDYVAVYSLTSLRIAALIWMALVGVGLVLICWRMLRGKSVNWLISANALAAGLVLAVCSGLDLDAVAAEWNVTHAREVGGGAVPLDVCYLSSLGDAALVPLSELELRPLSPVLRDKVVRARDQAYRSLAVRQRQWRGWTWRGQRRLERSNALKAD